MATALGWLLIVLGSLHAARFMCSFAIFALRETAEHFYQLADRYYALKGQWAAFRSRLSHLRDHSVEGSYESCRQLAEPPPDKSPPGQLPPPAA